MIYRSSEQRAVGYSLAGMTVFLGAPTVVTAYRHSGMSWLLFLAVVPSLAIVVLCIRVARSRVVATDEVTIVNPLGSTALEWTEIKGFKLGRYGPLPLVGIVELLDGSELRMLGISAPNPLTRPKNRAAQDLIATLNVQLSEEQKRRKSHHS